MMYKFFSTLNLKDLVTCLKFHGKLIKWKVIVKVKSESHIDGNVDGLLLSGSGCVTYVIK